MRVFKQDKAEGRNMMEKKLLSDTNQAVSKTCEHICLD